MQRYWWPGYEMQLLGELQRQQNSTQFCDTLLQTEGISVPTHSCILAALSPYLSQKLSASPSPPSGQKHQLQLQPVKAQTLLKLVGLLYSGEVEVKGSVEQNDVLAVARLFGIKDLVEGEKKAQLEGELQEKRQLLGRWKGNSVYEKENDRVESRKMQDAQVQAEMAGRTETDSPAEKRRHVSTGTQTGEKSVYSCVTCFNQVATPESVPSVTESVDFSIMSQPQNITLGEQFCSTSFPVIPSLTARPRNDATVDQTSRSVINLKSNSDLSRNMMTLPISLGDDSNSPVPLRDSTYQQSSECDNCIQVLEKETTGLKDGQTSGRLHDSRENTEEPHQASREEILGEESGKSTEKRHFHASVGMKNLPKMKQMQQTLETTQISVKVKLRRRTKGEVWEVVSPQDTDETLSVFTSHKRESSKQEPQTNVGPLFFTEPDTLIVQPQSNSSCICQPPSSHCYIPNQRNGLGTGPLPEPQGSVEESDEQIEKLLEDIMMGLNILPKDSKKSHHLQPSYEEVSTICQVPVTQNDAGCVFYQDKRTQSGHCSSETGIHCCLTTQNQPDTNSSALQPEVALVQQQQQQQQQRPPRYHSSVRFMRYRDGTSCESMPLSKSQECLRPEAPTARSALVSAFSSAGHKQHDPAFQEPSRQDNEQILEYLPTVASIETQSLHTASLPCMDDLRIRQCLSPLEPCTSATKHQTVLNQANGGDNVHPQSSLHRRLWLTENPESVQFPLGAISHINKKTTSLPQHTKDWLKQQQEQQELNPQNCGNWAESCTVKEAGESETISDGQQDVTELKSYTRKMRIRNKQGDTTEDTVAPKKRKRMCTGHLQGAASFSAYKDVRAIDGKREINLGVCSVSLSSNNVLAKDREIATGSLNVPSRFIGKLVQLSSITERLGEKTKESGVHADRTRIRTRGFMKKTQESPSNTSTQNSIPVPVCRSETVNNGEAFPRRKRGRPPKALVKELIPPDNNPAAIEKRDDSEEGEKTKRRHIKKRRSVSTEVEVKAVRTERTKAKLDANNNDIKVGTFKRPRIVTMKEFQRLIQLQHWKIRKSKESQGTNGTDVESEGIASGDSTCKESSKKNHNNISTESAAEEKSQQDNTDSSTSMDTCSFVDSPVFTCEVLQKEVPQLEDERELPLKNPDKGKSCDELSSGTTQDTAIRNERSSYTDSLLPQENRLVSDNNLYNRTADRTGSHLPDDGGMSRTSGCDQEEEEVDVLLFSPDRALKTSECENALNKMEISADEEEEDVNEIDVTGDEAE